MEDASTQGAVKHGRGNAYCTPDLCVMRGRPFYINKKKQNQINATLSGYTAQTMWDVKSFTGFILCIIRCTLS